MTDDSWRKLDDFPERLHWARRHRSDFKRPTDAARALGIKTGTYRNYEHTKEDGGRKPELIEIQRIARRFNVSWEWLLTGQGSPDMPPTEVVIDVAARLNAVPSTMRAAAARAAAAVIDSFATKAG